MNTVQISEVEFKKTHLETYAEIEKSEKKKFHFELQGLISDLLEKEVDENLNEEEVLQLKWLRECFTWIATGTVYYQVELSVPDPVIGVNCDVDDIRSYLDGNAEPEFEVGCPDGTPGMGYVEYDDVTQDLEIYGHSEPEGHGVSVRVTGVREGVEIPAVGVKGVDVLRTALNEFNTSHPGLLRQIPNLDLFALVAEFAEFPELN